MAVLFWITYTVLFAIAFVSEPASPPSDPGLEQSYIPQTSEQNDLAVRTQSRPVNIRKKVAYIAPPGAARQPVAPAHPEPVRSILVPRAFSYAVIQQPGDDPYYVSKGSDLVTEFGLAREHNNIGLLAHNNLAGKSFKYLDLGQNIYIVRTNGRSERYTVSAIYQFQALESTKTGSHFVDLKSGEVLTATEVFTKMYMGAPHLTLQTCIKAKGDASWGRLFVIATPAAETE